MSLEDYVVVLKLVTFVDREVYLGSFEYKLSLSEGVKFTDLLYIAILA